MRFKYSIFTSNFILSGSLSEVRGIQDVFQPMCAFILQLANGIP
jgi:hypothetical protein